MFDQVVQESNTPLARLVVVAKLIIGGASVAVADYISYRDKEPVFPPGDSKVRLNTQFLTFLRLIQRKEKKMPLYRRKFMFLKQRNQIAVECKDLAFDSPDPIPVAQGMKNLVEKLGISSGSGTLGSDVKITNVGDRLIDHVVGIA